jgi:O-antigen/teichoic acid export membrane protein
MSRKRLLARGVLVGYGALVTQIFYSLASIPLALAHLSPAEFGMFSLIMSVTSYLGLAELGMTNGFNRHLFECKDGRDPERYGRYFVAGLLALGLVSLVVLVLGGTGALLTAPFFKIPENLRNDYQWIMLGMVMVTAANVASRLLCTPLYVHQRHDLIQFSQMCQYGVFYFVLRYGLKSGWGVYALLANQVAAFLWGFSFSVIACLRLGLYPRRGCWALPRRQEWRSIFNYSVGMFTFQLGNKLAGSIPTLLLPRLLGLEAVALMTVCSRPFSILRQFVNKPYEYALPMLCEMYVKEEYKRVAVRWSQISQIILSISLCVFVVAAANNSHFIRLWTSARIGWDPHNDWLIALKFLAASASGAAIGVIGFRKRMTSVRYTPYLEAVLILVNGLWMTHFWGISGMLLASIISPLAGGLFWGIRHLAEITGTSCRSLFMQGMLRPLLLLPPVAFAAWACALLHSLMPGYAGLLLSAGTGTLLCGGLVVAFGVSREVRMEMLQMLMKPLGRLGSKFGKLKAES